MISNEYKYTAGCLVGGFAGFVIGMFFAMCCCNIEYSIIKEHTIKIGNARYNEITGKYEHIPHRKVENE